MGYRKVGYLEQIFYIFKGLAKNAQRKLRKMFCGRHWEDR